MGKTKLLGWLLLILALIVFIGLFVGYDKWWAVVDVLIVIVCGFGGIFLLKNDRR